MEHAHGQTDWKEECLKELITLANRYGIHYGNLDYCYKKLLQKNQHLCLTEDLSLCFHLVQQWMCKYFLQLNAGKTQIIVFGPPKILKEIPIGGKYISMVKVLQSDFLQLLKILVS